MMKRITALVLSMLLILSMSISLTASADSGITVKLNGKALAFDVQPQIINGRTMVPMRTIFEELGATVEWDQETQTVTSARDDVTVKLTIGIPNIRINQQNPIELDTAPCIIDGRTLVPVRAISEAFHMNVEWDGSTQTVLITLPNVNMTAYNELKDNILSKGRISYEDDCYYVFCYSDDNQYSILFTYDYIEDQISLFFLYEGDFKETAMITISPDSNSSLYYSQSYFQEGEQYKLYAEYPKANQPYVEGINTFPDEKYVRLLNATLRLMDVHMQIELDMSFDDFGLYYVK